MKRILLFFCLLLFAFSGKALDIITATIAVTNTAGTTNGQTLTVNSDMRTWTNSVQVPGSQILTNNTIGGAATNMFNEIAVYPFSVPELAHSGTNGIILRSRPGGPLSASLSAGWGTVVLTTNSLSDFTIVEVPLGVYPAAQQTNVASGIAAMLGANQVTNAIPETAPAMTNFLSNTNSQIVAGAKQLTNFLNTLKGNLVAIVPPGTPAWIWNPAGNSAALNFGGTGAGGSTNSITGTPGGFAFSGTWGNVTFGSQCIFSTDILLGDFSIIGTHAVMNTNGFFGTGTGITNLDGGTILLSTVSSPQLNTNGLRFLGTNSFPAGSDIAFGRYSLSSLGNGINQDIPVGTNVFIDVSGPSGAFSIEGIAGGRDGKVVEILNLTGFNMTIAVEGGATGNDPTPANRIVSMTGADVASTGNGFARLKYNSNTSRWVLTDFSP